MKLPESILAMVPDLPDYHPARAAAADSSYPDMPGLDGLEFVSTGPCPGCEDCGLADLADMNDDPERYAMAGEAYFSRAACDACGSTLGGDREPAHGFDAQTGDLVHLSICRDCVQRIEYPNGNG